jgi:FeS assembly SUF system protein
MIVSKEGNMDKEAIRELEDNIIAALKEIFDPEIPVDIFELGLIYEVKIKPEGFVEIDMTLTSPNCPVAESLPVDVKNKVESVEGVDEAKVNIVFDPPWDKDMMSEEAQLELGFL